MKIGIGLSSEELDAHAIVEAAQHAEAAGFDNAWVSDHYHPWLDAQGESPFVWSVLGAIAQSTEMLRVGTGVTCPTFRIHPAVIAQAAATTQCMFDGRFWLGVGSGEALNEHILAEKWPATDVRLEMLEEAIEIIRALWRGEQYSHYGEYFRVENARIYTLPASPPPIYVSAFGAKSLELAQRVGDGFVTTQPDADAVASFRDKAGAEKPTLCQVKVCWAPTADEAADLAFEKWPTSGLSGELSQDLPTPSHFAQAVSVLEKRQVTSNFALGPDPNAHVQALQPYIDAGFDEIYITQVGPRQVEFIDFFASEVAPLLAD